MKIRIDTKDGDVIEGEMLDGLTKEMGLGSDWVAVRVLLEDEDAPVLLTEEGPEVQTAVMYIRRSDVKAYVRYE